MVYNDYPREAAAGYNLRADCQWRTLVSLLNSDANAALASVTVVGRGKALNSRQ